MSAALSYEGRGMLGRSVKWVDGGKGDGAWK
jgi:hypothetical protein